MDFGAWFLPVANATLAFMRRRDSILVTGGAGFAGAHICEHVLHNTDLDVIVLDRISYAGSLERLRDTRRDFPERLRFVFHDFRAAYPPSVLAALAGTRYVIHNGGETHVERSLQDAVPFVESNVLGTLHTLQAARQLEVERFIQVSTDEVHGPAPQGVDFEEDAPIKPSNPYSASKAGGEAIAYSFWRSYKLPVIISRTMNLFGERQHPEKFIPMTLRKALSGDEVTIHGTRDGRIGQRKWLHARNQADGLLFLLRHGALGETYHIAGEERDNLQIAQAIAEALDRPLYYKIVDFHSSRPGHDLRYSLSDAKLRGLGWKAPVPFAESLRRMVEWTVKPENLHWLEEG